MTNVIKRRNFLAGVAATSVAAMSKATAPTTNPDAVAVDGHGLVPAADANPLGARIIAFTTVSPDFDASIRFYRDVIGFPIVDQGELAAGGTTAPGASRLGSKYALLRSNMERGAAVRILQAPADAAPNRPRPDARSWDPGLAVMECGTSDTAESWRVVRNAGTPYISSPRYYYYRAITMGRDLDVMSYAPFGPGGEQMFITANMRGDRPDWVAPGLHSNFASAVIVSLDQRPVLDFYEKAFGIRQISEMDSFQRNTNEIMGTTKSHYFLWGFLGSDVSIELEEHKRDHGVMYPTSLDRTGLAMITMAVDDLAKCRAMCKAAGIKPVGTGALPIIGRAKPEGFTLRGAVGELIEVVQKT